MAVLLEVFEAFEDGADDERKGDGGVFEDFGEAAAFFRGNEFAPGDGLGVSAAAEAAPVNGFGTDADTIVVAFERKLFVATTGHEFGVDAELLRPIARDAAADGEDTHFLGGHHGVSEGFKVLKRIESKGGTLVFLARVVVQGEIETQLGIGEGGDENGDLMFVSRTKDAATLGGLIEKFADAVMEFVTANSLRRIPLFEDAVDDLFDVIEIGFGLERVINAVVAGEKEFLVVHFGRIVAEVREASGFDEAVGHEGAGGDDGFDDAGFDEVAEDESHFADGEGAGEGHDDEAVFVAGHGFEDVGGIADLAGGVSGVAHGADEIVDGFDFGEIEGIDGTELVFDGIVEDAAGDGFFGLFGHQLS